MKQEVSCILPLSSPFVGRRPSIGLNFPIERPSRLRLLYLRVTRGIRIRREPRIGDYVAATATHPAGIFVGQVRFYDGAPLKLSRELSKIPVDRYRLPSDGRKWQHIARERMSLAEWLGVHGDGDAAASTRP